MSENAYRFAGLVLGMIVGGVAGGGNAISSLIGAFVGAAIGQFLWWQESKKLSSSDSRAGGGLSRKHVDMMREAHERTGLPYEEIKAAYAEAQGNEEQFQRILETKSSTLYKQELPPQE